MLCVYSALLDHLILLLPSLLSLNTKWQKLRLLVK